MFGALLCFEKNLLLELPTALLLLLMGVLQLAASGSFFLQLIGKLREGSGVQETETESYSGESYP